MSHLGRTVARNSVWGLAAQFIIKGLSFAFSILIVRNLGAEAFGQYAGVIAFGMVFVFLADLGLSSYAVREIARWRTAPDGIARASALYANLLALRVLLGLLTGGVIVSVAILTDRPLVMVGAIAINVLSLLLYGIQGSSNAVLSGFERLDVAAGANVLNQFTFVILGGVALWLGFGYYGLVISALLGVAVMTYVYWQSVRRLGVRVGRVDVKTWVPLLRASLPFGLIALALGLSYKFDSFLLTLTRGDAETGYYNAAYNLVFSAVMFSNVLNTALYPSLAREAMNSTEHLPRIYERALRYLLLVSLPMAVGISALAHQIVPALFKDGFAPAIPALQIVIWVVPLMYASEFLGYVVIINGNEHAAMRSVLISTTINVTLNLILIPWLGFIAAAGMTVVTEMVLVGQYAWLLRAQLRQMNWQPALRAVFSTVVMGALVLLLRQVSWLIVAPLGALVYGGLLLALGVVGGEEWRFVMKLRRGAESRVAE